MTAISVGGNPTAFGYEHSCALLVTGTVKCWGIKNAGELGTGSISNFSSTPRAVVGLTGALAISSDEFHTCAVVVGGR